MHRLGAAAVAALVTFFIGGGGVSAQVRLADESDR
jgi:hypothetical protein